MEFQEYTNYTYGDHYVRAVTNVIVEGQVVRSVDTKTWTDEQGRVKNIERVIYGKED